MKMNKFLLTLNTSLAILLLSGCASSHANDYIYNGINFGSDRNPQFKQGVIDACKTADGTYTKNRTQFNTNESYKVGWESGRMQCKGK